MSEKTFSQFLSDAVGESAKDAIDRYHAFLEVAVPVPADAGRWRLRLSAPVPMPDVKSAERRLGIRLPPSYVEFVTRYGLFAGPGDYASMFAPSKLFTLHDHLLKEVFVPKTKLSKELGLDAAGVDRLKKAICFASGQYEELLDFFDIAAADPNTGESPISCFDRQDMGTVQLPPNEVQGRAFDVHVHDLVNFNIREVTKRVNRVPQGGAD